MSSERKNINRVRRLSFETHTLTCVAHKRERERVVAGEGGGSVLGFIFWGIYIEEAFAGFFPLGFFQDKSVLFL